MDIVITLDKKLKISLNRKNPTFATDFKKNIKTLKIKANKNINLTLLHDPERSLVKRIKIEQIRRNFN